MCGKMRGPLLPAILVFPALTLQDWPKIRVEVSPALFPQTPADVANEKELIASLRPGIDGLIFTAGHRRATFSAQVWEQLPSDGEFLARLRQKAGLPAAAYRGLTSSSSATPSINGRAEG